MKFWSQDLYLKAWNFASNAHKDQKLPGSDIPYINHIGSVAMEVMAAIAQSSSVANPDLAVQCALLHDTVEDTRTTYEQVKTGPLILSVFTNFIHAHSMSGIL